MFSVIVMCYIVQIVHSVIYSLANDYREQASQIKTPCEVVVPYSTGLRIVPCDGYTVLCYKILSLDTYDSVPT